MRKGNFFVLVISFLVGATLHGQAVSPATGTLGQRLVEVSAGLGSYDNQSRPEYHGSLAVQLPILQHVDIGAGYGYADLRQELYGGVFAFRTEAQSAGISTTLHGAYGGLRPFLSGSAFRQWTKQTVSYAGIAIPGDFDRTDDYWSAAIGTEISIRRFCLTPLLEYTDRFRRDWWESPKTGMYLYAIEGHVWLSRHVGVFGRVSYLDYQGGTSARSYTAGTRLKF